MGFSLSRLAFLFNKVEEEAFKAARLFWCMSQTKLMGEKIIQCLTAQHDISKMISTSSLKYPVTYKFFKFHMILLFFYDCFIIKERERKI